MTLNTTSQRSQDNVSLNRSTSESSVNCFEQSWGLGTALYKNLPFTHCYTTKKDIRVNKSTWYGKHAINERKLIVFVVVNYPQYTTHTKYHHTYHPVIVVTLCKFATHSQISAYIDSLEIDDNLTKVYLHLLIVFTLKTHCK